METVMAIVNVVGVIVLTIAALLQGAMILWVIIPKSSNSFHDFYLFSQQMVMMQFKLYMSFPLIWRASWVVSIITCYVFWQCGYKEVVISSFIYSALVILFLVVKPVRATAN